MTKQAIELLLLPTNNKRHKENPSGVSHKNN